MTRWQVVCRKELCIKQITKLHLCHGNELGPIVGNSRWEEAIQTGTMSNYHNASKTLNSLLIILDFFFPEIYLARHEYLLFMIHQNERQSKGHILRPGVQVGNRKAQWGENEKGSLAANPSKEKHLKKCNWWNHLQSHLTVTQERCFPLSHLHGSDSLNSLFLLGNSNKWSNLS